MLVVSEWAVDMELVQLIRLAEMMKPGSLVSTDRNGHSVSSANHVPHIGCPSITRSKKPQVIKKFVSFSIRCEQARRNSQSGGKSCPFDH